MNVTIFEMEDGEPQAVAKLGPQHGLELLCSPPPTNSLTDPTNPPAISTSLSSSLDGNLVEQMPHRKLWMTRASSADGVFRGYYGVKTGHGHGVGSGQP